MDIFAALTSIISAGHYWLALMLSFVRNQIKHSRAQTRLRETRFHVLHTRVTINDSRTEVEKFELCATDRHYDS